MAMPRLFGAPLRFDVNTDRLQESAGQNAARRNDDVVIGNRFEFVSRRRFKLGLRNALQIRAEYDA